MNFFGTDRRPVRRIWISETEAHVVHLDDPVTEAWTAACEREEEAMFSAPPDAISFDARGNTAFDDGPRLAGFEAWLPK